jgi:predicted alpha/beta-hydrolase family hydrolase
MGHPFMAGAAEGLVQSGISCLRFNFPYMEAGRRAPDRPLKLLETWRGALDLGRRCAPGVPLVAGGKSMGGRMASVLAADEGTEFQGAALVFLGYPLHAPGQPTQLRDAHLFAVTVPMLFIQGTQDPFARFDLLEALVKRLGARARLRAVEGADHSFRVRGRKRPDHEIGRELGEVAGAFAQEVAG